MAKVARIVQLSDLHLTSALERRAWGASVWDNLRRALDHVRGLGRTDLLVVTGDLANERRPETYARLREAVGEWGDVVRVVPGNHDDRDMLRSAFADRLMLPDARGAPKVRFVAPVGDFRALGLDTLQPWRVHGRLGDEQLDWLARELDEAGAARAPTLLFMHHPPTRVGAWWLDKDMLRDHVRLRAIVEGGGVRGIFCGHVHQESSGIFGGASVWTTPSTAYQFPPRALLPRRLRTPPAFRIIDLDGDRIDTRVVRL